MYRADGRFLVGRRSGAHGAGTWAPPGGHVEWMETVQDAAIREVAEETGLMIAYPEVVTVTNDMFTDEGKHYITVWLRADCGEVNAVALEDKFTDLRWVHWEEMPEPMFLTVRNLVDAEGPQERYENPGE